MKTYSYAFCEEDERVLWHQASLADEEEGECSKQKRQKRLMQVIENELTLRQQEVLRLYYFDEVNIPEIAKRLGRNKSTVWRTLKRGENTVRRYMQYTL